MRRDCSIAIWLNKHFVYIYLKSLNLNISYIYIYIIRIKLSKSKHLTKTSDVTSLKNYTIYGLIYVEVF